MLPLVRPPVPDGFADEVATQQADIRGRVEQGQAPKFSRYNGENGNPGPAWSPFKARLTATINRCAFCEVSLAADRFGGDVEHFRPKEKVSSRFRPKGSVLGYWWLAYCWANYLPACFQCNRKKGVKFPLIDEAQRHWPPQEGDEAREAPLLLNPYEHRLRPSLHLSFDVLGQVAGESDRGSETVTICGLDRSALRSEREEKARSTHAYCDAIERNDPMCNSALKSVFESGRAGYAHAGMVRVIFERRTGLTWEDLEELVGA